MRFFVENIESDTVILKGTEAHHLKNVLRKKAGDAVFLFDGKGNEYRTEIKKLGNNEIELKVLSKTQKDIEPKIKINLYQSIPKLKKFDFIVEKSTELGVSKIIPVISERTVYNVAAERSSAKLSRWQKIALSASKQCGRTVIPEISSVMNFDNAVKSVIAANVAAEQSSAKTCSLIFWECEQNLTLKKVLSSLISHIASLNLFIGPEGGFSNAEIDLAKKNNIISVSLGKRILRAETAPIVVISNILYELEL